jgi:nitrous oxide reductase
MNEQTHEVSDLSRRRFLKSTAVGLAAASTLGLGASTGKANESSVSASSTIPELAPQWKKLDLVQ